MNEIFSKITDPISVLSLVISVISLFVSFLNYFKYRFGLKIISHVENTILIKPLDTSKGNQASLVADITIINNSAHPITIYDITQKCNKVFEISVAKEWETDCEIVIPHMDENEYYNLKDCIIKFPLKLNPYECISGFILFPATLMPNKRNVIKIRAKTARGIKRAKIQLYSDYNNSILP